MRKPPLIIGAASLILLAVVMALNGRPKLASTESELIQSNVQAEVVQTPELGVAVELVKQLKQKPLPPEAAVYEEFSQWMAEQGKDETEWLTRGTELAQRRSAQLTDLMRDDPESALIKSLSFSEYAALPSAVAQWVEKPFSAASNLLVLPVEPIKDGSQRQMPKADQLVSLSLGDAQSSKLDVLRYGRRLVLDSKEGLATQGFSLNGIALIDELPLRVVNGVEAAYLLDNFVSRDNQTDAYTNESIDSDAVIAIAGGEIFYFASQQNVESLNNALLELEQRPGPFNGSPMLFKSFAMAGYSEALLLKQGASSTSSLQDQLLAAAGLNNPWTTTKKDVFFIRIDFSDKPASNSAYALPSQAELSAILNDGVTDQIRDMSGGRTWIEADVSASVVRTPQTSLQYTMTGTNALHNDSIAAFNGLNTGIDLANYDIIGVYFTDIDTPESDTFDFGGLAGGSRQWIQDSASVYLIVHEFGHNYGAGHASYWATTNGSSVGAGSSQEYGNVYDILGGAFNSNGYFHPQTLERLDWIETNQWSDVSSSGLHRIHRFDDPNSSNVQTARMVKGPNEYYWLGYRQRFGNSYLRNGLQLLWQRPSQVRSWLVDTTPGSTQGIQDTAISLGRTYVDSDAGVYITPIEKGGTAPNEWIDVQINIGDFSANQAPSVEISGPTNADARKAVAFSAVATDPENDDLVYQWDLGDGVVHTSQSTVQHIWAIGGTYTVTLTVSDMKGQSASDTLQVVVSDPLDNWLVRSSSGSSLNDIASDGSILIAVGNNGSMRRSTDNGETWSSNSVFLSETGESIGSTNNLDFEAVDYSGSLWTAVGSRYDFSSSQYVGRIYTSSDGITWRRRLNTGPQLSGIASNGIKKVASGYDGVVLTSSDGVNWQQATTPTTKVLNQVAYGNGRFVAVGQWQRSPPGSSGITYAQATVLVSTDGETWVDFTSGTGLTYQGLEHIGFIRNIFFANGFRSSLLVSQDGEAFSRNYSNDTDEFAAFAYGNGVYLAAGESSSGVEKNAFSINGLDWQLGNTAQQARRNGAIFFANSFITVGNNGSIYQSSVLEQTEQPFNQDDDLFIDSLDNCPSIANDDQANSDDDELGDACDTDDDDDGRLDADDCAPLDSATYQPYMAYLDTDLDTIGTGDLLAICAAASLPSGYSASASNDNCPLLSNVLQTNSDADFDGDACDANDDNDAALDVNDCARIDASKWQLYSAYLDADNDDVGTGGLISVCGPAVLPENYTVTATNDNCPSIANPAQVNADSDEQGDKCDSDQDNDGILDGGDISASNPSACQDSDFDGCDDCAIGRDGFGPLSDNFPLNDGLDTDTDGMCNQGDPDDDNDNVNDVADNCPLVANDQADSNRNGIGDACDGARARLDILDLLPAILSGSRKDLVK
jgi:hypothetical protein